MGIFGPVLSAHYASSVELIARILAGTLPGTPGMRFGIVDGVVTAARARNGAGDRGEPGAVRGQWMIAKTWASTINAQMPPLTIQWSRKIATNSRIVALGQK